MGDGRDDPRLMVVDPELRGIMPLENFHISKRLQRRALNCNYKITADRAFREVIEKCGSYRLNREETWINRPIISLYDALHRMGFAHSVEVWDGETLVGGLYGVSLGAAFFGESMFSLATDTSKIALIHLVAALLHGGYRLLDAQFYNPHLEQFGLIEIPRAEFLKMLSTATNRDATFHVNLLDANLDNGDTRLFDAKTCLDIISAANRRAPNKNVKNV